MTIQNGRMTRDHHAPDVACDFRTQVKKSLQPQSERLERRFVFELVSEPDEPKSMPGGTFGECQAEIIQERACARSRSPAEVRSGIAQPS